MNFTKKDKSNEDNNKADSKEKYNFALYIPEIKHDEWKQDEDGIITIIVRTNDPVKKFLAWMVKRTPLTNIKLDERCSNVWKLIDGNRTVYDIAKIMSQKYNSELDGELYRLVTYLKYISKRGWIKFIENQI